MKEKIKKTDLILIIMSAILIITVGGIWWYQHQQDITDCKERCEYNEYRKVWQYFPPGERSRLEMIQRMAQRIRQLGHYARPEQSGWIKIERELGIKSFPKQEQCIDYCLTAKE